MAALLSFSMYPTVADIDDRITALRDEIRQLEEYRNARFLAVSRLPPEVLSIIFEHLALEPLQTTRSNTYDYGRYTYYHWLSVTQVCRLWRNVALESPRVWGCVCTSTPRRWAEVQLERARSAPLYLRRNGGRTIPETITLLLQHSDRLKEVDLPECDSQGWFTQLLTAPVPHLETLSLSFNRYKPERYRFDPEVSSAPPLRHLKLLYGTFDLDPPVFHNLRSLVVRYDYIDYATTPAGKLLTPTEVLVALQKMSQLEVLELDYALGAPRSIPPDLTVTLLFLTDMRIDTPSIHDLAMIKHISAPNVASVYLRCREKTDPEVLAPIASAFYAFLPSHIFNTSRTVAEVSLVGSSSSAAMKIWVGLGAPSYDDSKSAIPKTPPSFQFSVDGSSDLQTALTLCTLLPTTEPIVLDFNGSYRDAGTELELRSFFRALTGVKELHLHAIDDVVFALSDTPNKKNRTPSPLSLPSLRRIFIEQHRRVRYKQRLLSKLKRSLVARKGANAAIELLVVRANYEITEDDIITLPDVASIKFSH